MSLSPGLIQACAELLGIVSRKPVSLPTLRASFTTFGVVATSTVLEEVQQRQWLVNNAAGFAELTPRGRRLLASEPIQGRMRQALIDVIETERPAWIQSAIHGRRQVLDFVNTPLAQVFLEAGLVDGTAPDIIAFWDNLAAQARGQRDATLLKIGRQGERLSIAYETRRTGRIPKWISVETNGDGFDLLSVVGPSDSQALSIEVKATTLASGTFHLSRNEWEYGRSALTHVFHLWDIASHVPRLAVIDPADVARHIPADNGNGEWQQVLVPFHPFDDKMSGQADVVQTSPSEDKP